MNQILRQEVMESQSFIALISNASLNSMYVAFEMGARWGSEKHFIPLLAPGVSTSVLGSPLNGLNALRCDNRSQLHQLIDDLAKELKIGIDKPAAYEKWVDKIQHFPPQQTQSRDDTMKVKTQESEIDSLIDGFLSMLKNIRFEWTAERNSNPKSLKEADHILSRLNSALLEYYGAFSKTFDEDILAPMIDARTAINKTKNAITMRTYDDNEQELWEFGNKFLDWLKEFVVSIQNKSE